MTISQRRVRLRQRLADADLAAMLVSDLVNVRYLSGFTGSNAALLIRAWHMPSDVIGGILLASLWMALAVAKPFVRSVTWLEPTDATPHLYPNAGLFRADHTPKPLLSWMKSFRREILA